MRKALRPGMKSKPWQLWLSGKNNETLHYHDSFETRTKARDAKIEWVEKGFMVAVVDRREMTAVLIKTPLGYM